MVFVLCLEKKKKKILLATASAVLLFVSPFPCAYFRMKSHQTIRYRENALHFTMIHSAPTTNKNILIASLKKLHN